MPGSRLGSSILAQYNDRIACAVRMESHRKGWWVMVARRRWTVVVSALAVTLGSAGSPALGSITYLTSFRAVRANGFVNGDFEGAPSFTSSAFGDFNRMTSHTFSGGRGSARASQLSRLLPERIEVTEFAEVVATGLPQLEALAESRFDVTFRLNEASSFTLTQSHVDRGGSGPNVVARLRGPAGDVFNWGAAASWPPGPIAGTLPAGEYTLFVQCLLVRVNPLGTFDGSASLTLNIPSPIATLPIGGLGYLAMRRRTRGA